MTDGPTIEVSGGWQGGMKFTFEDGYGHNLTVDAPEEDGDPFDGFMPAYMLMASLAACAGIDIANILRKQRQELSSLDIRVRGVQDPDPPWAFNRVHLQYDLRGAKLDDRAVQRAIDLSENRYCSIGATISGKVAITSSYTITLEG